MAHESIQPILDWISLHPTWAGIVVFLISLSESLVVIGLVVPGVVMMTAIGVMIGNGILPGFQTMTWAVLGAIAGDGISYWVGHHYHQALRNVWPFRQYPRWLARGERFFAKHGGKSIIFGRFIGPVRPMIPVIAGMMDMTPRQFLFFNILSAIAWAPIYTLPGMLIGVSLGTLTPETASRVALLLLLLLFCLWLLYNVVLRLLIYLTNRANRLFHRLWSRWRKTNHLVWLRDILTYRKVSKRTGKIVVSGQLGLGFVCLFAAYAFWVLTHQVIHNTGLSSWNEPIYQALRALYSDKVVDYLAALTNLGEPLVLLPVVAIIGVLLFWKRQVVAALCWLGTMGLGGGITYLIKHEIPNPRPYGLVYASTENSFPSGHALVSAIFFGFMALFIRHYLPKKHRWIPWTLATPIILLIAFSRVYLGQHWFTDILGSWALAAACLSAGWIVFRHFGYGTRPVHHFMLWATLLLLVFTTAYNWKYYEIHREHLHREWQVTPLVVAQWWKGEAFGLDLNHRQGAFKRKATLFDVQWLGTLDEIHQDLIAAGWVPLPKLTPKTALILLSKDPTPNEFPVMPKFHRDRLPMLTMAKVLSPSSRLVLQLWQSDHQTHAGVPLWVGTIREEAAENTLPLVTLYREVLPYQEHLQALHQSLSLHSHRQDEQMHFVTLPATVGEQQKRMLLIREPGA